MGKKDTSLIHKTNPTFIAISATASHYCLSAWKTCEFRFTQEFCPGGRAQRKYATRNIHHVANDACRDEFCLLELDCRSSSPELQAKQINNICSMIRQRIDSNGTEQAMVQPSNDQGSVNVNSLDWDPEELLEQPINCSNSLRRFVPAMEASMRFTAVLPMGGSAIACSSLPILCSNSNSNSNDITTMTSIENTGLVDGSTFVVCSDDPWGLQMVSAIQIRISFGCYCILDFIYISY
jgi:hypothetical protein